LESVDKGTFAYVKPDEDLITTMGNHLKKKYETNNTLNNAINGYRIGKLGKMIWNSLECTKQIYGDALVNYARKNLEGNLKTKPILTERTSTTTVHKEAPQPEENKRPVTLGDLAGHLKHQNGKIRSDFVENVKNLLYTENFELTESGKLLLVADSKIATNLENLTNAYKNPEYDYKAQTTDMSNLITRLERAVTGYTKQKKYNETK
jgi:hypothetical protein